MSDSSPITPEFRENLVAYLDGELDEVGTVEVERTLSESADVRQEVEALSRTWDLLETLPPVEASSAFTERTMASLESASMPDATLPVLSARAKRNLIIGLCLAGGVLCAVLGFLITNKAIAQRSDPLVKDLPVIENLELYEEAGTVKFLEELTQQKSFTHEQPSEPPNNLE